MLFYMSYIIKSLPENRSLSPINNPNHFSYTKFNDYNRFYVQAFFIYS